MRSLDLASLGTAIIIQPDHEQTMGGERRVGGLGGVLTILLRWRLNVRLENC